MAPLLFDVTAWKFTVVFVSLQLIFHWILPHDTVYLLSSAGNRKKPVNGFSSSLLICLLYVMGCGLGMYRDDVVFIHFPSIITCFAVVCVIGYLIMLINYRFGDYYNVTTVSEFCFGVELHPTILDIDVKHFVRSRITLVLWPMFIISALYYQRNRYGKITSSLAASSVMFPVLYCSSIASIAHSQKSISFLSSCVLTVAALIFIYLTTVIDKQKYEFRKQKGIIKINGVDPYFITAKYKDDKGDTSANLLLGSGYWSLCRHPNYIFEAATFAVFSAFQGYSPISVHFPALFVAGFLFLRLYNDESRCLVKYGQYWIQYCNKVPFRLIPGLY
ncbi:unnamed protein product [Nippostrongylus brasiliensis]|uniref:7-dehydrocholesterol reductase n=1 Tax=Nippostrongylus brasiliensis TaxID=27835 RepID=A0A0N4YBF2_NIPBR|nr:unnamed protein product [Nippostrongylus brasiliensis]